VVPKISQPGTQTSANYSIMLRDWWNYSLQCKGWSSTFWMRQTAVEGTKPPRRGELRLWVGFFEKLLSQVSVSWMQFHEGKR
jgi:hypothetical protein